MTGADPGRTYVGVDVGGTHTDVVVVGQDGIHRAKAFTTHDDYSRGVVEALGAASGSLGIGLDELLSECDAFVNATTIVTNVIAEFAGARVGFLVTHGFRDTFRLGGGPRRNVYDDHQQTNIPDLLDRDAIREVRERIDYRGEALVALAEDDVHEAARFLLEEKQVDAIAVGFLWSFRNPAHELRAREIIAGIDPETPVSLSHEVFPVIREHERWTTALLNAFVQRDAVRYIEQVEAELRGRGLRGRLSFFQGLGGTIAPGDARRYPIFLLGSGPVGGVMGANALALELGVENVLCADMGGTSFDASLIEANEVRIEKRRVLGQLDTGLNMVEVVSIGAGGGSVAWIDARGVPQVGPQSAGSLPGPACYGRGGSEPTVTDALLVLGYIDPDDYLGGRHRLDRDAAEQALATLLDPLGWSIEAAAAGIHDLVVVNMANALREISVEKGRDPREFVMVAYGGALPLFALEIARLLEVPRVVVPENSSAFSAFGLLTTDYVRRFERTVEWVTTGTGDELARVNTVVDSLVAQALEDLRGQGFAGDEITLVRTGDFRFEGQVWELTMPVPERDLSAADGERFAAEFPVVYERSYGPGTAWKGSPVVLLNYSVTAIGRQGKPPRVRQSAAEGTDPSEARRGERLVYSFAEREPIPMPVYDDLLLRAGHELAGPAIINAHDTTIFVPAGARARRDDLMNYHMTLVGADSE